MRQPTALRIDSGGMGPWLTRISFRLPSGFKARPMRRATNGRRGAIYLFAVAMRGAETSATFQLRDGPARGTVEVIDENRKIMLSEGGFSDKFPAWGVHLYKIAEH